MSAEERTPFLVRTSCDVHGQLDAMPMPSADAVVQAATAAAAELAWGALHRCDGRITATVEPHFGGSDWTYAGEAPFLRGTIPGTRGVETERR